MKDMQPLGVFTCRQRRCRASHSQQQSLTSPRYYADRCRWWNRVLGSSYEASYFRRWMTQEVTELNALNASLGNLGDMKFVQQSQMMILQNPFESKSLKMSQSPATVRASDASAQTLREESLCFSFPERDTENEHSSSKYWKSCFVFAVGSIRC